MGVLQPFNRLMKATKSLWGGSGRGNILRYERHRTNRWPVVVAADQALRAIQGSFHVGWLAKQVVLARRFNPLSVFDPRGNEVRVLHLRALRRKHSQLLLTRSARLFAEALCVDAIADLFAPPAN